MKKIHNKITSGIIKKTWPSFMAQFSFYFTLSSLYVAVLYISQIIWPGEPFHAQEIGWLVGIATWMMGIAALIFGPLADKISRTKLLGVTVLFYGVGYFANAFAPAGLGNITYYYFLGCVVLRGLMSGAFFPIINSYITDATGESERSQYYGLVNAFNQVSQIGGMVLSALIFQYHYWREYYLFTGIIIFILGLIILFRAKEPKRGSTHHELKEVLASKDTEYKYKLTKKTIRETFITPTNIIALVEGLFTTILVAIPDFLILPYFQSAPHYMSPLILSLVMTVAGIPGGLIGAIGFAKLSDRLAKKNIRNRVVMITLSGLILFGVFLANFLLPFPEATSETGGQIGFWIRTPTFWVLAGLAFIARLVLSVYNINQPPILQKINLPEAQGRVASANQLVEMVGSGLGPVLAGTILATFGGNYQTTAIITMSIGFLGSLMWLGAFGSINRDSQRISKILRTRAIEMKQNQSKNQPEKVSAE